VPLFAALAFVLASLAGCGSGSGSVGNGGGTAPHVSHGNPETILEDEGRLHTDPAGTLDLMRRWGVSRVRVYLRWQALAPSPEVPARPQNFNAADSTAYPAGTWAIYDTIVRDAAQRGIGIDLTLGGPAPLWANGRGAPRNSYSSWKPFPAEFGAFVRAAASRYSGRFTPAGSASPLPRVRFWAIWNEPNYGPDLSPQAVDHSTIEVSPLLYRGLLDAAWSALQATGHGSDTILIGETAPRGQTVGDQPGNFSGMVPLRFVRALYCVDANFRPLTGTAASLRGCPPGSAGSHAFAQSHPALFKAGGFADHPYPLGGLAPNQVTPAEPDYADLASLPKLEQTLDRAQSAYGTHSPLPIYSTEFGYQTNPPETIARTTHPATAARYLNWAEYISWRDPRVRSYDQFLIADPPGANASGGFATGLLFKDGTPKATLDAFRLPIFLPAGAGAGSQVEVWGCARPAAYVAGGAGRPPVQIQFLGTSSATFKTVATVPITDPHGYFDTRVRAARAGYLRLAWTYPHGPTIHSRVATVGVG
jgi:hypothetical protein